MLSSLLKIEQFLKCEVCLSTLRQTRIVAECGHRFCLDCISEKLAQSEKCPTCELPATSEDMLKDPMHDNLVSYVNKLKVSLLSHSLTPLGNSLLQNSSKRVDNSTQDSSDNLEDEYSDLPPDRKKFKKSDSFLDDLLSVRPTRNTSKPNYVIPTEFDDDIEMDAPSTSSTAKAVSETRSPVATSANTNILHSRRIPDETETTGKTWTCTECEFENQACLQTCGVCKKFKNRNIPMIEPITTTVKTRSRGTEPPTGSNRNTMSDQSLEGATLPIRARRRSQTTTTKDVHVMFTAVSDDEKEAIDKSIERVAESKLKFTVGTELKDMEEVTHVISSVDSNKKCFRTLKYLSGVLHGKWIVTPEWLLDSMKAKQWLPEETYEIQGDAKSGLTHAPFKGRQRRLNHEDPLFYGMHFYFAGEFSEKHNKKDLGYLVDSGGGVVERRRPASSGTVPKQLDKDQPVIICGSQTNKKKLTWLKEYQVRNPAWIVESISRLKVE